MKLSDQPIFIVGCERSGTTVLRLMLNEHSKIALPPQTKFSRKLYKRRMLFGDLSNGKNNDKIIDWILERETNIKLIDLKLDNNHLRESWEDCTTIGEITGTVFQQYSQTRHKSRWGDKRPYYIRYIPQLLKLYPDARIIHVIRNGHDCIASLKRMPWWNKNSIHSMLNWRHSIRMGVKAAGAFKDQFLEVRYEDIVRHPETQLKKICDFINVKYESGMLEFHLNTEINIPGYKKEWHHKTFKPLSDDAIDKGKEQLSENELILFSWCAGEELNLWNYDIKKGKLSFSLKYFKEWVKFYSNIFLEKAIDRLIDVFYFYPMSYNNKN